MNSEEMVAQMTLEEKAGLCSGKDFWHMKGIERLGLPSLMVTDGPHGLRKQAGSADHLGINESVPATCFPAACATSSSFDEALLEEIGAALGEECLQEDVAVILGPGANIKRSPLCGRNFEYISEDPYVTGKLAAALIRGVQGKGIGTSMKHYAANNQEKARMTNNSVVDMRALREIYLTGFEMAVKEADPWTLMCSYNKVNGTYASENKWLLTEALRDEWGFGGLVMTDWGATNDRVEGIRAGLDLEMPASGGHNDAKIVEAVQSGQLAEADLDKVVVRLVEMILKAKQARKEAYTYDADAHHTLARKAASASCVLLENRDETLPLTEGKSLAVIGAFAKTPRYQGAGSSKINPSKLDNAWDALAQAGCNAAYAPGYTLESGARPDPALLDEAAKLAAEKDVALVFAGLPDEYESEGFDRSTLAMPDAHNQLIEAVAAANPNTVVVLQLGAPVEMPWAGKVKAVLVAYLGGQAGGGGCADVLLGKAEPGGRLAETWPKALADTPCAAWYPGMGKTAEYRESLFVGYRYYDAAGVAPAYPFGFGRSYTQFKYSGLRLSDDGFDPAKGMQVTFTVANTGQRPGSEVAQLYLGREQCQVFRAPKELKGFSKLHLQPGESRTVTLALDARSFAYYNEKAGKWALEGGEYTISVGASSADIRLAGSVQLEGDGLESLLEDMKTKAPVYYDLPSATPLQVDDTSFTALYGRPSPPRQRNPKDPFTINSTLDDIKDTMVGRQVVKMARKKSKRMMGGSEGLSQIVDAMIMDVPLRSMMMSSDQMSPKMMNGLVDILNGKLFKGLAGLLSKK